MHVVFRRHTESGRIGIRLRRAVQSMCDNDNEAADDYIEDHNDVEDEHHFKGFHFFFARGAGVWSSVLYDAAGQA